MSVYSSLSIPPEEYVFIDKKIIFKFIFYRNLFRFVANSKNIELFLPCPL